MDGEIDGEDDGDRFDDSHPGPSGLGSASEDINAGFLGGPVGLCIINSFLPDVSVPRSLCPYSPSLSSSSPVHSPQSVRCLSPVYSPPPTSVRSHSPVNSTPARGRGHSRGRGRSRSRNMVGAGDTVEAGNLGEVGALLLVFLIVHIVLMKSW